MVLQPGPGSTHRTKAALLGGILAEVAPNARPQAGFARAVKGHLPQPFLVVGLQLGRLLLGDAGGGVRVLDQELVQLHVLGGIQQNAVGFLTVSSRAARLLVIALQVLGHIVVHHQPHVGFVNAHAEGVGGHHHSGPVKHKVLLAGAACLLLHARMVAPGLNAPVRQHSGHPLGLLASGAVHNAAVLRVVLQQFQQR